MVHSTEWLEAYIREACMARGFPEGGCRRSSQSRLSPRVSKTFQWSIPPCLTALPSSRRRCYLLDGISKGAWLNRSSIIFAGKDKWSVDPRVSIVSSVGDKHEYSLQIQKVDVTDDGQYTCSIQSERNPRPKLLNLIVKGESSQCLHFSMCWCVCTRMSHSTR